MNITQEEEILPCRVIIFSGFQYTSVHTLRLTPLKWWCTWFINRIEKLFFFSQIQWRCWFCYIYFFCKEGFQLQKKPEIPKKLPDNLKKERCLKITKKVPDNPKDDAWQLSGKFSWILSEIVRHLFCLQATFFGSVRHLYGMVWNFYWDFEFFFGTNRTQV